MKNTECFTFLPSFLFPFQHFKKGKTGAKGHQDVEDEPKASTIHLVFSFAQMLSVSIPFFF